MHWNYRRVRFKDKLNGDIDMICEVYYGDDGKPAGYTEAKISFEADDIEEGERVIGLMRHAFDNPSIRENEFVGFPDDDDPDNTSEQ